jgi:hypothetical protein
MANGHEYRANRPNTWLLRPRYKVKIALAYAQFFMVCPSCKNVAAKRGRYMLGEERLTCNRCGATDSITFWRFEGIAQRACTAEPRTVKARAPSQDGCGSSP